MMAVLSTGFCVVSTHGFLILHTVDVCKPHSSAQGVKLAQMISLDLWEWSACGAYRAWAETYYHVPCPLGALPYRYVRASVRSPTVSQLGT